MATALQAEKHFTEEEELRIMYERREDFLRDQRSREYNARRTQEKLQETKRDLQEAQEDLQEVQLQLEQAQQLNALYAKLAALGRFDDIQRITVDANHCKQLLEEFTNATNA